MSVLHNEAAFPSDVPSHFSREGRLCAAVAATRVMKQIIMEGDFFPGGKRKGGISRNSPPRSLLLLYVDTHEILDAPKSKVDEKSFLVSTTTVGALSYKESSAEINRVSF